MHTPPTQAMEGGHFVIAKIAGLANITVESAATQFPYSPFPLKLGLSPFFPGQLLLTGMLLFGPS